MTRPATALAVAFLAAAAAFAGCSGQVGGHGQLRVSMMDGPNPAVEQIWVNVTSVRAHSEADGWFTVSSTPVRVDLLTLADHAIELGLASLPPGRITQIRLLLARDGNTVVTGGVEVPLDVPSGAQSGIKIKGPWVVDACTETAVLLDFDGHKSIWYHPTGQGDRWILRPVIRTVKSTQGPGSCEPPPPTCDPELCPSGLCDPATDACAPGGAGTPCQLDEACLSNICIERTCMPGGSGTPCRVDLDCDLGTCGVDGLCTPEGAPAGSPCTEGIECLSGTCDEGSCAPGGQGAPCTGNADCATGFACSGGTCEVAADQL